MDPIDLLIVGAGWSGIAMAKTYHEAYSDASIRILDAGDSIGGSWAADRIYPGLNTNNLLGSYEFSDFPMDPELVGTQFGQHIPGEGVHRYLCAAAKHFDIERTVRLRTRVETARLREDHLWEVSFLSAENSERGTLLARKLVIATGLTSEPFVPTFEGQETFRGLIIHSKQLPYEMERLAKVGNVAVVGGNKSAWDVCYAVARSGGKAHMIIRPSGGGPSWVWPTNLNLFGWKISLSRMALTRFWTLFDPWPLMHQSTALAQARSFLHRSWVGRQVTRLFWSSLGGLVQRTNRYSQDPRTAMLVPWISTYWMGNSLSTLNYPSDWFEHVRQGRIIIHHADVLSLSSGLVHLTNGIIGDVGAMVCCTGWKSGPSIELKRPHGFDEIGWPGSPTSPDTATYENARRRIWTERPDLRHPARTIAGPETASDMYPDQTYRLYRFIVPPSESSLTVKNLAFIGMDYSLHTVIVAQAQALWITAFFNDLIPGLQRAVLDSSAIREEAILMSEYERLRRPRIAGGSGEKFPDLVFDSLPYVDTLLADLRLRTMRKDSTFADILTPYGVRDYRGVVEEWKLSFAEKTAKS